jgi:hypothetical protein
MRSKYPGMHFYRESNGAYMVIDVATNDYYKKELNEDSFEARHCITYDPIPSMVNTGTIGRWYLKKCKRVSPSKVPKIWLERLV